MPLLDHGDVAPDDLLYIVDVSDTTDSSEGSSKRLKASSILGIAPVMSSNSMLARASGSNGQGGELALGEGTIPRRLPGENLTAGKVVDELCAFASPDGKYTRSRVAPNSQVTGNVATSNTVWLNDASIVSDGFYRVYFTILITNLFDNVDHMIDTILCVHRIGGVVTKTARVSGFTPPSGIALNSDAGPANTGRLGIVNTTGYTHTYYSHFRTVKQVK